MARVSRPISGTVSTPAGATAGTSASRPRPFRLRRIHAAAARTRRRARLRPRSRRPLPGRAWLRRGGLRLLPGRGHGRPRAGQARSRRRHLRARDIFTLGREYAHAFDGVWEYTCFCAIDPMRRAAYVQTISPILKPGGWLWPASSPCAASPPARPSRSRVPRSTVGSAPISLRARPAAPAIRARPPAANGSSSPVTSSHPSRRRRSPDSQRPSPGTSNARRATGDVRRSARDARQPAGEARRTACNVRRALGVGLRSAWPRARPHGEPSSPLLVPGSASEPPTIQLSAPQPPLGDGGPGTDRADR